MLIDLPHYSRKQVFSEEHVKQPVEYFSRALLGSDDEVHGRTFCVMEPGEAL
jgi:hypothetical protein